MIDKTNFKEVLKELGFSENKNIFSKQFASLKDEVMAVDCNKGELIYPALVKINDKTTCNFEHPENFVVFECVHRLLEKGYRAEHIELEKRWNLGHESKGGKADICVYDKDGQNMLLIIECKTAGTEYSKALKILEEDGGQLFSYWQQERSTKWISLYASDYRDEKITFKNDIIDCSDDSNVVKMAEIDASILLYKNATSVKDYFTVWSETYHKKLNSGLVFGENTQAYNIGVEPLRKKDLKDFEAEDKIVNKFEEILRHNNVSDKENAFNRLVALFICKLVDEITKNDDERIEFQYKQGSDTYETLQDRLQRLHTLGMKDFMGEDIFYVSNDYAENLFKNHTGQKRAKAIEDLKKTIRILKFYSNNDFSFKDVHNEELFFQNGKILVEVVQLFENYRIVYPSKHQFLGDLFEQLLNKGFKQSEGQFFTPMPITRFIWDSLPLKTIPKVIDYACGSGHFLTEAVESINKRLETDGSNSWVKEHIFGIEKDYRLARVAKISLFMNGAGGGNIIFGDGLENNKEKQIENGAFDILVANPPYSVSAFKKHLKLKNNAFELLSRISSEGSEIETLFVERISQLLKPKGIAAVILPSSILSNDSNSYVGAREVLLKNFMIRSIVQLGSKTFGATGTNTVILFLEKYNEPPKQSDLKEDSAKAIIEGEEITEWEDSEILDEYLKKIDVKKEDYLLFISESLSFDGFKQCEYLNMYIEGFKNLSKIVKLQESNQFKKMSEKEQNEKLKREFYNYAKPIECEKLIFFGLIYKQKVLIVSSPSNNDEQKRFLGYDWSNRKGAEGIQIQNPGGMLYNESDRNAIGTIAASIRSRFSDSDDEALTLDDDKKKYCALACLADMIDFSRVSFNKAIKLTPDKKIEIKSRYPLVKLGYVAEILKGKSITLAQTKKGNIKVVAGGIDHAYLHSEANRPSNTITISASGANAGFVNLWKEPIFASDCTTIRGKNDLHTFFIYNFLLSIQDEIFTLQKGAGQPHVYPDDLKLLKIPNIDENLQRQIVAECEKVDEEYNRSRMSIEEYKRKIEKVMSSVNGELKKLGDICTSYIGLTYKPKDVSDNGVLVLRSSNIQDGLLDLQDQVRVNCNIPERLFVKNGDVLVCVRNGSKRLLGKSAYINDISTPTTFGAFMAICRSNMGKWIYLWMQTPQYYEQLAKITATVSINQLTQKTLLELEIPVPSLSEQQRIIEKIEGYELEISKAKEVMATCTQKKKMILEKWL